MEYAETIGEAPWSERIVTVGFQSIIAHTAASSTIDFGALSDEAALVMMLPMFIGADAASTAGGIKVATFLVTMLATISCSYRESAQPITRAGASIWGELLLSINVRLMMPISRSRRGTALRKHAI